MESDDADEQIADSVEDIVTHTLQVHAGTSVDPSCTAETIISEESFSHLAHIDEDDEPSSFTARLQNIASPLATPAAFPKKNIWR